MTLEVDDNSHPLFLIAAITEKTFVFPVKIRIQEDQDSDLAS